MSEQRGEVQYFPITTSEQCKQCPTDGTNSNGKGVDVDRNEETGSNTFLYISACAAHLVVFACGLSMGWTSPIIPKLNGSVEPKSNPLSTPLTHDQASWLGSLLPIGAIFGPFITGVFIDRIGRKNMLLTSAVLFVIAFNIAAFVRDLHLFYLMRFLCGQGLGIVFSVVPVYVAEISEKSVRALLGTLLGIFLSLGFMSTYIIGPYISLKVFNLLCSIVPALFIPLFWLYIPDSPHYLILANRESEAEEALIKFRGKSHYGVQKEFLDIKESVEEHMTNKISPLDIFRKKALRRALILSVGLVSFQQLSGINVVLFYTQTIFAETGSSIPPEICTIIFGAIQVASNIITPIFAERAGKRFLLILSALGMFLSLTALGIYFYLQENLYDLHSLFWFPVLSLASYILMFTLGFASFPFAIMGELFPLNAKCIAATITTSVCWGIAFVVTKLFLHITELIGIAGTFWIFSGCCVIAFIFIYKLLPETSGKSLREIQDILNVD